jgi:2,4-dienoyl-CoA reductase-like NADH-dependent reductase (Old Yellow Enzyme family)
MKAEPPKALPPQAAEDERRVLRRDPNPHLFRPLALRSVTARNRIMLSPMCQYSAADGVPNFWHMQHLGARAAGGAGIVCTEVTHVEARGRITPHCLGLWDDAQRDAFAPIAAFVAAQGAVPAIQLGHAGRKASVARPWDGGKPLAPGAGGWIAIGPSALPFGPFPAPKAMGAGEIAEVLAAFRASARRAREAGFKLVEVHGAHGYLLHEFLSPLSNMRTDHYGGSLENRARLLMETLDVIRAEWPAELPLALRLSCTDWVPGGWAPDDAVALARLVAARGDVDFIDCSSGGSDPAQQIPVHPGYQVGFAERIRRDAKIATAAVGLIHSPDMAEEILANGRADLVVLGRTLLGDPMWPLRAAKALKARNVKWPVQYERADIF